MGFVDWSAIVGWLIVLIQNGIPAYKWVRGKVTEVKDLTK